MEKKVKKFQKLVELNGKKYYVEIELKDLKTADIKAYQKKYYLDHKKEILNKNKGRYKTLITTGNHIKVVIRVKIEKYMESLLGILNVIINFQ